jgi:pimeloyl-ACP methyl ester carboxylesterase
MVRGRCPAVAVAAVAVLVAGTSGCSDSGDGDDDGRPSGRTSSSSTGSSSPARSGTGTTDDAPELVDIGGSRYLSVRCTGTGSPVVVLESGDESDQYQWQSVLPEVAERTRVCSYDRFGNGGSDPASGCRRTPELLADLAAMLAAVDAEPPYVLVGTSGGGFLMTSYAYAHPEETAGIVLAETPHAIIPSEAPPELLDELDCRSALNQEHRDYVAVERWAWEHRHRIGRIPMTVISNDYGASYENEEQRTNVKGQQGWLVLSPLAKQVLVTSGHDVPQLEWGLTVQEILRVVDEARR